MTSCVSIWTVYLCSLHALVWQIVIHKPMCNSEISDMIFTIWYLRSAQMFVFFNLLYTALPSVGLRLEKCPHLQEEADIHIRDGTLHSSSDSENMEYIILDTELPSVKPDQKFSDPCENKIKPHSSMTICYEYICFTGKPGLKEYPPKTETPSSLFTPFEWGTTGRIACPQQSPSCELFPGERLAEQLASRWISNEVFEINKACDNLTKGC